MDTGEESNSKFLDRAMLDTVTEGATEGITDIVDKVQWDVKEKLTRSKSKKKLKGTPRSAVSPKSSSGGLSCRPHTVSQVPSNSLRRQRSRVASAPQQRPTSAGLKERMEKRVHVTKRVQSAPEVRALTPPTLHRTKQGCPLTFSDLLRAEEKGGFESKWVLQCIESDLFNKTYKPKKRITSAPPRFHHPPGSLRPAYMDKPPNPAVEPAYDEEWHDKIVEQHETRRRVAEQRHFEAAERRRLLNSQQLKKAAVIRDKCYRSKKTKTNGYGNFTDRRTPSPPPGPLPTAISLHSSLNYRVKSAMSFTAPGAPPSPVLSRSQSSSATHITETPSPVLAKAAVLRNASELFLCYSAAATASVG
ncbi:uncharacterized protein LOC134819248 isoform X2 [Bolinopsis microptera]|uniref:uncharacterized protein LOC134819248 isoform X2 n=1 Tax=Bolinopsis microptera TaxID=2820187 RepID=UPI0030796C7D